MWVGAGRNKDVACARRVVVHDNGSWEQVRLRVVARLG